MVEIFSCIKIKLSSEEEKTQMDKPEQQSVQPAS